MKRVHRLTRAAIALIALPTVLSQGYAPTATNQTGPLSQYKSRPDIYAPGFNMTIYDEAAVTPGYIFIGAYQTFQAGLYIYDNTGNLVYSGYGGTGGGPSHNFHVCNIKGTDQLCYITGGQNQGYVRGQGVVMDNTFTITTSIKSGGGRANFDEHEFNVVDGGRNVLMTLYQPEQYDLTAFSLYTGQGWIMNCYFQKLELGTNRLLFEWDALSHVPIDESTVPPNTTEVSGTGLNPSSPWDWFHINSVDQNADGDYLISARHTSTIYKISGLDGHIIWRLGGSRSNFSFPPGQNFTQNFTFQHDARFRFENTSTTILSLFDNGSNGYNNTKRYSSGVILAISHIDNTVTFLRRYIAPFHLLSASQGNLQLLGPNTAWDTANTFHGWGQKAYVSEYANNGTMVQMGYFATTGSMNYRAFKYNYTMNPTDSPALYAYSQTSSSPTVYYVSWNGATRVSSWRLYGSANANGPWSVVLDSVPKNGFETMAMVNSFQAWGMVEAVDVNGVAIRNSTSRGTRTFVPGSVLAASCNQWECPPINGYYVVTTPTPTPTPTPTAMSTSTRSVVSTSTNAAASGHKKRGDGSGLHWGGVAMMGMGAMFMP